MTELMKRQWFLHSLFLAGCVALLCYFWEAVTVMAAWWGREEYSHGPLIPVVAAFLVYQKIPQLQTLTFKPSVAFLLS